MNRPSILGCFRNHIDSRDRDVLKDSLITLRRASRMENLCNNLVINFEHSFASIIVAG